MSDNDTYETSASDGAGTVYAQLTVPSFLLGSSGTFATTTATSGTVTSGGSFLRLGSFPDLSDTTSYTTAFGKSLVLARLVGDTSRFVSAAGAAITYADAADT